MRRAVVGATRRLLAGGWVGGRGGAGASAAAAATAQPLAAAGSSRICAQAYARKAVSDIVREEREALRAAQAAALAAAGIPATVGGGRVLRGGGAPPRAAEAAARARDGAASLASILSAGDAQLAADGGGSDALASADALAGGAGGEVAGRWQAFSSWARSGAAKDHAHLVEAVLDAARDGPQALAALADALDGSAAFARGAMDLARHGVDAGDGVNNEDVLLGEDEDDILDDLVPDDELDVLSARLAAGGLSAAEERDLTERWHLKASMLGDDLAEGLRASEGIDEPLSLEIDRVLADEITLGRAGGDGSNASEDDRRELGDLFHRKRNKLALQAMMAPTALPDFRVFAKLVDAKGRIRPRYHTKLSKQAQNVAAKRIKMMRNLGLVPIEAGWDRLGEDGARTLTDYVPIDNPSPDSLYRDLIDPEDKTPFDWFGGGGQTDDGAGKSRESFRDQMRRLALERQSKAKGADKE